MSRRLSSQIRNQWIGVLSLFLVLAGGTAYATHPGGTNTISSGDIINGQVRTPDLRDQEVTAAKLGPSSVNSAKVANNSLTGDDINESTLSLDSGSSPPAFTNATLQNGWTVSLCCPTPAGFYKHAGRVYLRGYISGPANTTAFVLPEGYRPSSSSLIVPVYSCCGTAVTGMSIDSNGGVTPFGSAASLSGVSFRVNE